MQGGLNCPNIGGMMASSSTQAQHSNNIGPMYRVCWDNMTRRRHAIFLTMDVISLYFSRYEVLVSGVQVDMQMKINPALYEGRQTPVCLCVGPASQTVGQHHPNIGSMCHAFRGVCVANNYAVHTKYA